MLFADTPDDTPIDIHAASYWIRFFFSATFYAFALHIAISRHISMFSALCFQPISPLSPLSPID
jgi:hypothetical protein